MSRAGKSGGAKRRDLGAAVPPLAPSSIGELHLEDLDVAIAALEVATAALSRIRNRVGAGVGRQSARPAQDSDIERLRDMQPLKRAAAMSGLSERQISKMVESHGIGRKLANGEVRVSIKRLAAAICVSDED